DQQDHLTRGTRWASNAAAMSISIPKLDRCEYLTEKTLDGEPRRARRGVVGLLHAAADPRSEETAPVTPEKRGCSNGCKTSTRCAGTLHRKAVCRAGARWRTRLRSVGRSDRKARRP